MRIPGAPPYQRWALSPSKILTTLASSLCAKDWMSVCFPSPSLPISCAEMLISKVMVGDRAFGSCLGHGGRGLLNISVLIKETPECSLVLPPWRTQWEICPLAEDVTQPCWHPDLRLSVSVRYTFLFIINNNKKIACFEVPPFPSHELGPWHAHDPASTMQKRTTWSYRGQQTIALGPLWNYFHIFKWLEQLRRRNTWKLYEI